MIFVPQPGPIPLAEYLEQRRKIKRKRFDTCTLPDHAPPYPYSVCGNHMESIPAQNGQQGVGLPYSVVYTQWRNLELCTSPLLKALDSSWHRTWVGDRSADVVFSGPVSQFYFVASGRSDGIFLFVRLPSRSAVKKWIWWTWKQTNIKKTSKFFLGGLFII